MELNYRQYSEEGEPVIILHGLFGSLKNWNRQASQLAESFRVFSLDLRNHGGSPHADSMTYREMAADVVEFLNKHKLERAHFIGHSMGGKVAMQLALDHPELVDKLIVVDIAPIAYSATRGGHDEIFKGLEAIDPARLVSRTQADDTLAEYEEDVAVRQFLLSNLEKENSGYRWRFNLPVLRACYDGLRENVTGNNTFDKTVLFIKGALSNYIRDKDKGAVLALFPQADVKSVMNASHWVHAEKPELFFRIASDFLSEESAET